MDQATQAGEEFSNVYYETFDKRRHVSVFFLPKLHIILYNYSFFSRCVALITPSDHVSLQLMSKLYSANTTIVWNGNVVKGGSENVTEFFNSLPATEHTLHSLDCQPVSGITWFL